MIKKHSETSLSCFLYTPLLAGSYFLYTPVREKNCGFFLGGHLYVVQEKILLRVLYIPRMRVVH